jgi:AcrR family transcriptional regulator
MSDKRPRQRDPVRTSERLLEGVALVLVTNGLPGLGVNAVAQAAGVDKALIYRYFGGLEGMLRAYAERSDFWPPVEELVGDDRIAWLIMSPAERLRIAVRRFVQGLRARPATLAVIAGETASDSVLAYQLKERRDEMGKQLFAALQVDQPHRNPRLHGTLAIILAGAMHYLLAQSLRRPAFGGVPVASDQDWAYIDEVVGVICARVLDDPRRDRV